METNQQVEIVPSSSPTKFPITFFKSISKFGILLFIILSFALGFYFGIQYEKQILSNANHNLVNQSLKSIPVQGQNKEPIKQCKVFDENQITDFIYVKYTVKKGDTMLSVAQDQLGSSSRIADIIYVNMNNYPGLSIQNPYIEPGWIFYLPRPFIKKINIYDQKYASYQLPTVISASILKINVDNSWTLIWGQGATSTRTYADSVFINKQKSEYKKGDCLTIVEGGSTGQAYGIFPQ